MSFGGELRTFDVFDLLEWVAGRQKSGLLQLVRLSTKKKLAFGRGALLSSTSNDPRETMGQVLVRDRLIDEETLFRALLKQEQDRRRLGDILVQDGLITQEQLVSTLRATTEAQLYDVFLWPDGRFDFDDAQPVPAELRELAIDLRPLLDEGRHRRELSAQLRARFPSSSVTFRITVDPVSVGDPAQREILNLAAFGRTLAAIGLETRRSEYETMLLVADMCDEGLLVPDRLERRDAERDPVGTILVLLDAAGQHLAQGRADAALEAYEKVLAIDPINQAAKKGLFVVSETRRRTQAALKVPQEKIPVLRVTALALAQLKVEPEEGFVLSRINGQWDVRSILKLCPFPEERTLHIFSRLIDKNIVALR